LTAYRTSHEFIDTVNTDFARDRYYAQLTSAASAAASDAAAAARAVNDAEARRLAIASDISRLQSLIATEQDRLNQAAADAQNLSAAANSAGWDIASINGEVARLCDVALVVRRERDEAACRLREA